MDLEKIKLKLRDFAEERDWEQFHDPKNLSMALSVEVAELVEIFQWSKSGGLDEINNPDSTEGNQKWDPGEPFYDWGSDGIHESLVGYIDEMENNKTVTGIAIDKKVSKITIKKIKNLPGTAASILKPLSEK